VTLRESILDGFEDVRTHKLRTVLQTLGVVLGVASLVAVQGLVDAGRRRTLDYYAEIGGLKKLLVVNHPPRDVVLTARQLASPGLTWSDAQAIRREVPQATLVDPIATTSLPVRHGNYLRIHDVAGVTPDYAPVYSLRIARGRFLTVEDLETRSRAVVLGDSSARSYFGNEDPVGKILYLDDVGFTVVGVLARKEFVFGEGDRDNALEWMNRLTLVPLTTLYVRFTGDPEQRVEYINVMVDEVEHNPEVSAAVTALLYRRHGAVTDFEVFNRSERMRENQEEGQVFDVTFMVAGLVSLIVGGIVIMNIMLASLQERIREVGVRKAIGAKGTDIAVEFLVESILVTSIGGALGLVGGVGFARLMSDLIGIPTIITPTMAVVGVVSSVGVGLFFGLYPALRAARLNPVEALRYE
jgi:ABC-type antimicrobial peptide transport system permease subunit